MIVSTSARGIAQVTLRSRYTRRRALNGVVGLACACEKSMPRTGQACCGRRFARSPSPDACQLAATWGTPALVFVPLRGLRLLLVVQGIVGAALVFVTTGGLAASEVEDAAAQPEGLAPLAVELTYDAPAGCGDRLQVLHRAHQLLAGPKPPRGTVRAVITVRLAQGGLKVNYEATRDALQSRRDLVVTDCAAVVEASALLLMLTLDPVAAARIAALDTPSATEAESDTPEVIAPKQEPAATSQPQPAPTRSSQLVPERPATIDDTPDPPSVAGPPVFGDTWAGIGTEFVTGLAPNPALGVRLDLGTSLGGVRFGVTGSYDWVSDRTLSQASFASLASRLYRLRFWAGPAWRSGIVQFGPLLSLGAEHLRAEVVGISDPVPGAMTWLSAGAGGHLDVHLAQSLALRAQASAVLSLERRSFSVRGIPGLVHQPHVVGIEAATGLVWVWGGQ